MWPQPHIPSRPAMSEETLQSKLAAAKRKIRNYQWRNSLGVPRGTTTSGGCHSPGDVSLGWPGSWGQGAQGCLDCGRTVGSWLRILCLNPTSPAAKDMM
uniref:Uncharacterized protein n=1 Tax=Pan troglodytes TaxID=9598 RepID=A0A2I3T9J8_PANTR